MSFPPRASRSTIAQVGAGVGAQLTPVPSPGIVYSGVQWYRDGEAIPEADGGRDVPYVVKEADVPASGQPGKRITCELTGLTLMTLPITVSNA